MIDTQKIQSASRCISGIAEVAATLARARPDHCTHTLEVSTCFPLDIETVGRILEGLEDRPGIEQISSDGVPYLYVAHPDDYNLRQLDLDGGEHLSSNASLLKHLSELRSDASWVKKVREQHELLRIVASMRGKTRRLELEDLTSRSELPSARIQSALNDLSASGYIMMELGEESSEPRYVFPEFDYPRGRYQHNMRFLEELTPSVERTRTRALWGALAVAMLLAVLAVVTMLRA